MRAATCFSILLFIVPGCHKDSPTPGKNGGFPGYDSPPIEQLVADAVALGPPKGTATPYVRPAAVRVPPLPSADDLSWLPKDEQGRSILNEVSGSRLLIDPKRSDPITGMANCGTLVSSCMDPVSIPGGRTLDACWASAPVCKTKKPWEESPACCPHACSELYERLRKLNYAQLDASHRTRSSKCFNSLQEYMKAP